MAGVIGQVGHQAVAPTVAVVLLVLVGGLDLHAGHVHTRGAIAFAAFARDAQVERIAHRIAGQCIRAQLAAQGQTQGVGATACEVLFVTGDAVAGAHGARIKFSAVAVVVAHVDRFGQAAGWVATAPGFAHFTSAGVGLNIPGAPIQGSVDVDDRMARVVPHQGGVVHARWVDHALGAQQTNRVHFSFDLGKGLGDAGAKLPRDPLSPAQAIAVLAAVSPFEFPHQGTGLFGNGAHFLWPIAAHVQNGPHMQGAHRGMGVPGAACAVLVKHLGERGGVLGQMFQGHGAVFDKAHRFAIALEAHHDVQAGLAHFPEVFLRRFVHQGHHAVGQAQARHAVLQVLHERQQRGLVLAMEFNQQNGLRLARQSAAHGGRKSRVLHGQVDHGAVDQLHCAQCTRCTQLDDVLCGLHGLNKGREVHHAQHFGAGQGAQAQCQRMRQGQGAFAAHQQMGQVDRPVVGIRPFTDRVKNIQVVASHPAQHARPVGIYFGPQVLGQVAHKVADAFSAAMALGHGTPIEQFAIAEPGLGPQNVVHHVAVGDGAAAAGVVARHATQCRLATGGDIHRVPQAVWFEGGVQVVEHDAGLHRDRSLLGIQVQNLPQMLAVVDDQTGAHGLTALTGAAATGYQGHAHATANVQRGHHILAAGGHQDAHGHLLVSGGVG